MADGSEGESSDSSNSPSVVSGEGFESPSSSEESVIEDEAEIEQARVVSCPSRSKIKSSQPRLSARKGIFILKERPSEDQHKPAFLTQSIHHITEDRNFTSIFPQKVI